jgi:hypothetical protein
MTLALTNILASDIDQSDCMVVAGSRAAHTTPALRSDLTHQYVAEEPQFMEQAQFTNDSAGTVWSFNGRFTCQSQEANSGEFSYVVICSLAAGAGASVLDWVDLGAIP